MKLLYTLFYKIFRVESLAELLISVGVAVLIYVGFHVLSLLLARYAPLLTKNILRLKSDAFDQAFAHSFAKPVGYFLRCVGLFLALEYIPFTQQLQVMLRVVNLKFIRLALIILISIAAQNFIEYAPLFFKGINAKFEGKNKTIIAFFTKLGKALIIALTAVIILNEFGYDINGLIAGLGLSGLTFALAAQDTASNFVSGVVILMDKPFAIGDWIAVGSMEGVVEEMNFRSCRIRTFDNAVISVPNNKLSGDSVTNWTKMNMRKTKFTIGLLYSTDEQTIRTVCQEIRTGLSAFSEIKKDTILVNLSNFSPSSLDILIQYHSFPVSLAEHMALREKVNYMILNVINTQNTEFAYPTYTLHQQEVNPTQA